MRYCVASTLLGVFFALISFASSAQTPGTLYYQTYLDLDGNTATGCTVTVPDHLSVPQTLTGIETSLILTVTSGVLVSSERFACVAGVMTSQGMDAGHPSYTLGGAFIEYRLPSISLTPASTIGFAASTDPNFVLPSDVLFSVGGNPISLTALLAGPGGAVSIPVSTPMLLLLLAMASGLIAARYLRTAHGRYFSVLALFICLASLSSAVYSALNIILDGNDSDWAGATVLAVDAAGDAPHPELDLLRAHGVYQGSDLYLKLDLAQQPAVTPPVNTPPVVTSTAITTGTVGTGYSYAVIATDADGDPLTYTLTASPSGMSINAAGLVEWTTPVLGSHTITVTVSDGTASVTHSYTLVVSAVPVVNTPPVITSTAVITGTVGTAYSYQVTATDADGDTLTYTLTAAPTGMVIDALGEVTWPTPVLGSHNITVSVSDGTVAVTQNYTLVVSAAPIINHPPVITSTAVTTGTVGTAYSYQVTATDADGDTLIYSLTTAPTGMVIDAAGEITWATPVLGSHNATVSVNDGTVSVTQNYTLVISAAPIINHPPVITSTAITTGTAGTAYSYGVTATDADGDTLTYSLTTAPAGMSINAAGLIAWATPVLGSHNVTVSVNDGTVSVTQNYTLVVSAAPIINHPPVITSTAVTTGTVGTAYSYAVTATDADGDTLTYSLTTAPVGMTINASGLIAWAAPALGSHNITVSVNDGTVSVTQNYTLVISAAPAVNTPPVISSSPITIGMVGNTYSYQVTATDADGDVLTYSLSTSPSGMSISAAGFINWPAPAQGAHSVTISVSDGTASVTQSYTLTISPASVGAFNAQLTATPAMVNAGQTVSVGIGHGGGRAPYQTPVLTLDGSPVTVSGAGASYTASVSSATLGLHTLALTAKDADNTVVTQTTTFLVRDPSDVTPPVALITAPARSDNINVAEITTVTNIIGTASDAHLADYRLLLSPANENNWVDIGGGTTSVTNGNLGKINPQTLANGLYDLALIVRDNGGNETSAKIGIIISGEQKIGQFVLSFTDFDIDMRGLPLQVTRTYDTRRQFEKLDFGMGWSVDYQNVKVQTNGVIGRDWELAQLGTGLSRRFCPRPFGSRVATVRLPDGRMERFDVKSQPECVTWMEMAGDPFFTIRFEPKSGTRSSLEATDIGQMRAQGGAMYDYDSLGPTDPQQFKLTTQDGTVYTLDKAFGIRQIKDRHGNTLTYNSNGIVHSDGASLLFTRDAQGRIKQITAPDGRIRHYRYDADGNQQEAEDPKAQTTRHTYHAAPTQRHQLHEIYGADGKRVFKAEFDSEGRLNSQSDGKDFTVSLGHDTTDNKDTATNRRGHNTVYVYDDTGNITEVTDALGGITRYTYDSQGNELTVTDPLGRVTTREYDAYGHITKETNAAGHIVKTEYNANGNPTKITDALGRETKNVYDVATGDLKQLIDASNKTTAIGYSMRGDLASITDALSHATSYGYTTAGGKTLKTSETDAAGKVTSYGYDAAGHETSRTQSVTINGTPTTVTTSKTYDANGNVLTDTDAAGKTTTYVYDSLNQLTHETDPLSRITRYEYNERGEQTKVTYPDGSTSTTTFDPNGNETQSCQRGVCTSTEYDALDRPTKITDAVGNDTHTAYDAAGQVTSDTDARGNVSMHEYDLAGRKTKSTDALAGEVKFEYDLVGNLTKETNPRGQVTEYVYDANNRRTETKLPTGSSIKHQYDDAGRRTADIDALNQTTQYGYDNLGRLNKVTDALNNVTTYGYDERGLQTGQKDAEGHNTAFAYDAAGRRSSRTLPMGEREIFAYDELGRLTSHTDFNGQVIGSEYDVSSNLSKTTLPGGRSVTYSYDSRGTLTTAADSANGNVTTTPDILGRPTSITSPNGTLDYAWDANGNKRELKRGAAAVKYEWDALNRLSKIIAPDNSETKLEYDAAGNRTRITRSNGSVSDYSYNAANQLTGIVHKKADNSVLASFAYTLDANGCKTKAEETVNGNNRTVDYTYDDSGKLTQEKTTAGAMVQTTDYQYDKVGNRTQKTVNGVITSYTYNANDQLTEETTGPNTTSYTWDSNGNLTRKTTASGNVDYTWSADNRLTRINDAVQNLSIVYSYDAEGKRIGRTLTQGANVTETRYLVDPARPYSEIVTEQTRLNSGPWTETTYLHTPDGAGDLITQTKGSNTTFVLQDGQGSSRLILDNAQHVLETMAFDAFGNRISGATQIRHQYVGESFDEEAGLYHLRARDYSPAEGRFVSRDVFEGISRQSSSLHKYAYVSNDPVNDKDPSGYFGLSSMMSTTMNISMSYIRMEIGDMISNAILSPIIDGLLSAAGISGSLANVNLPRGNVFLTSVLTSLASMCVATNGKRCYIKKVPVMSSGNEMWNTSSHIAGALFGQSNTVDEVSKPLASVLIKRPGEYKRGWYNKYYPCNLREKIRPIAGTMTCDEYPYASTWNGGHEHYKNGDVSLMMVPHSEQSTQATLVKRFYGKAGVGANQPFINLANPLIPSFYIDKKGRPHSL